MVVKWPIIDQGPISRLFPYLTPNFLGQPERIWNAKGSESKSAEKKERKLALKKYGTGNRKKKRQQHHILAYAHAPK